MGLMIGLTYDSKEENPISEGQMPDANAELDPEHTIRDIEIALESGGHQVKRIGNMQGLLSQVDNLGVDIVFNIAEGLSGRNRESQVPMLLELYNLPYIGSDALTMGITLDKLVAKKCFIADGIPTARFFEAESAENLEKKNTIGFPLMVKPRFEGTSKGITALSRVKDFEGLKQQVQYVTDNYSQSALVEEFIKGREITIVVLGNDEPEAMPPVQYAINDQLDLGENFYTFEMVMAESVKYICPAKISESLTKKLQDMAIRVYKSVKCRDFGRVDFRVDENENIFVLEINPLPCLARKDTFFYVAQALGKDFNELVLRVLNEGMMRLNKKKQLAEIA